MENKFNDYLKEVELTGLYLKRACKVINFYEKLFPDDIKDIFVSEYTDNKGTRQYESLWIFTSNFACEAKQFITEEDFDATSVKQSITYWRLKRTAFDGQETSDDSRMAVSFDLTPGVSGALKASKGNCMKLQEIFDKYLFPNTIPIKDLSETFSNVKQ